MYGAWLIEELARHGYRLSPGTLYPILHRMQASGLLTSTEQVVEGKRRRCYVSTPAGDQALEEARRQALELVGGGAVNRDAVGSRVTVTKPDGTVVVNGSVPAFEPGGPKNWSQAFSGAMPLSTPLRIIAYEGVWSGAWWLWDRYEDDIRVRKYASPEPTLVVAPERLSFMGGRP